MAKRRPLTSPAFLYRLERLLLPRARRAWARALAVWLRDVKAGRAPRAEALAPFITVVNDGLRLAGLAAAEQVSTALEVALRFDVTNPAAVRWARQNAASLITNVHKAETIPAIRAAITRSMRGDLTVQQVQRYVNSIVGLTKNQELAVYKVYETALDQGLSKADALAESQIYAEQLRKYRAEVIARTEVLKAESMGQELLWRQAKAEGYMKGWVKRWMATPDEITCPLCGRPDGMDGKTAEIGEPWILPEDVKAMDGTNKVMVPQDLHAQCRCSSVAVKGT